MSFDPLPQTGTSEASPPRESVDFQRSSDARVDVPHTHAPSFSKNVEEPPVSAGPDTDEKPESTPTESDQDKALAALGQLHDTQPEQFTRQAEQLVDWIRNRQDDLDQREANLNALAAHLEQEQRKLRLTPAKETANEEQGVGGEAWNELQELVAASKRTQAELQSQVEKLENSKGGPDTEPQPVRLTPSFLEKHRQTLEQDRRKLLQDMQALEEDKRSWKLERESQRQQLHTEAAEERRRTQTIREQVLAEKNAVRESKDQLQTQHGELLHLQLALQQLWSQVQGNRHPAELTEALARIRQRISGHYEYQQQDLNERRMALKQLATHLADAQTRIAEERRGFEHWMQQRNQELEKEAAMVLSKERDLQLKERQQQKLLRDWERERRDLQQQIRDLADQLEPKNIAESASKPAEQPATPAQEMQKAMS